MAETSKFRPIILDFIFKTYGNLMNWKVLDIGSGDDPLLPDCDKFDLPDPYTTNCKKDLLTYKGDARVIDEIVTRKYKVIYSSHLLEDFDRSETVPVLERWISLLEEGGMMIILCPDQQRYEAFCKAKGELPNIHHRIEDFSLQYLVNCFGQIPNMVIISSADFKEAGDYNFIIVAQKIPPAFTIPQKND